MKKIALISMHSHHDAEVLRDEKLKRFPEELVGMGYGVDIFFFDLFFISLKNGEVNFFYKEEVFDPSQYLMFLPIFSANEESSFLLEALESSSCILKNRTQASLNSKDKAKTSLILNKAGLKIINSGVNFSQYFLGSLLESWDGDEYVCKLRQGSLGKAVSYIKSNISLISNFEMMVSSGVRPDEILFEEFIKESFGKDLRIVVAGGEVVASMQRESNGFDFRANLSSGGKGFKIDISKELQKVAIDATKALGLDYSGVDFLLSNDGPLIVEVNSNPGLKIEEITGINVARKILERII